MDNTWSTWFWQIFQRQRKSRKACFCISQWENFHIQMYIFVYFSLLFPASFSWIFKILNLEDKEHYKYECLHVRGLRSFRKVTILLITKLIFLYFLFTYVNSRFSPTLRVKYKTTLMIYFLTFCKLTETLLP